MRLVDMSVPGALGMLQERLARSWDDLESAQRDASLIIGEVRARGDEALREYSLRFDGADVRDLRVSESEIRDARSKADPEFLRVLEAARENIAAWHSRQVFGKVESDSPGRLLRQITRPIRRVGLYVPSGAYPLPSTVLMNAVPAVCAGVDEIALATPPRRDGSVDPGILAAAAVAGVSEIYRMGGAQAIAAFAYGTQSVPKVDKVFGPGNIWVTAAKKLVYGDVGVDMLAGPSEVLIIAGSGANPDYIAADLLAQAEHDALAACVCVSWSSPLLERVGERVAARLAALPESSPARKSVPVRGFLVKVADEEEAAAVSDAVAPEHLELLTDDPEALLARIRNAGSVFLGEYTPEPLGDYFAGVNHTLPTMGTARFNSPLSTYDFVKRISVLRYGAEELREVCGDVALFARQEGLVAHAASIESRFEPARQGGGQ